MTITLTGIGWDHPRGFDCYRDTAAAFHAAHPEIEIRWDTRTLREFGEAPIGPLAERYDFIIMDHPFSGKGRSSGCLTDLGTLVPDVIAHSLTDEVGQSARSYHYDGGVWGLPTDAAAQIAVYRPDLLERLGAEVPRTHDDVLALARRARARGQSIGLPSCPTDAAALLMSYAANLGHPAGRAPGVFLQEAEVDHVLGLLAELFDLAHPLSSQCNPIRMHELMCAGDEVVYVPLMFGYSNYSRQGRAPLLRAADFAGPGPVAHAGALLGGAGCAVSARCRHPEAAATYLRWLHRPEVMSGAFFRAGGQPGSRAVWENPDVNAEANGFFADTLRTLDTAYLRPRFPDFVPFFEVMGETVHAYLTGETDAEAVKRHIRDNYRDPAAVDAADAAE
jgi:multiple sugar transport system substrate-binding protein